MIQKIKLQIQVLQIKLAILLLRQKRTVPNLPGPKYVVVHHGAGNWNFHHVNKSHKDKWGFKSSLGYYIGYHKWISYNGTLITARRDNEEGAHTVEKGNPHWWNRNSVGICLQGNTEIAQPTEAQLTTLRIELNKYNIPIKQHREIYPTLCPGKNLSRWLYKIY